MVVLALVRAGVPAIVSAALEVAIIHVILPAGITARHPAVSINA